MRIAVSGSHGTGKSTLITAFLARRPDYLHEAEAYEALADEIDIPFSEGPTPEGLEALLACTNTAVTQYSPGALVVFERSPVDYLAYAAASGRAWPSGLAQAFLAAAIPLVKASVRNLDLIAFLGASRNGIAARPDENPRFRRRVDEALRRALFDDEYDLFDGSHAPRVVELPASPERHLAELMRLATA